MNDVIRLVTDGYIPVPECHLLEAERVIAELRSGGLTGFVLVATGPEAAGERIGFCGGRMDRLTLLGNLAMMRRQIEDVEIEETL